MKKTNKHILWAFINAAAFIATITINALANTLPLNNKSTGELSDAYPNLFVPAGLTFSIWGVIYLLLAGFVVYQVIRVLKNPGENEFMDKIGPVFLISSLVNCSWIFAWHWENVLLSLLFMFAILGSLLSIYLRLDIGKEKTDPVQTAFVHLPFSVYLGWITVATIANITALLVDINWDAWGLPHGFWTVFVMAAAIVITILMLITRKDIGYSLVVLWAFLGIFIKRSGLDLPPDSEVEIAAITGMAVIGLGILGRLFNPESQKGE